MPAVSASRIASLTGPSDRRQEMPEPHQESQSRATKAAAQTPEPSLDCQDAQTHKVDERA